MAVLFIMHEHVPALFIQDSDRMNKENLILLCAVYVFSIGAASEPCE